MEQEVKALLKQFPSCCTVPNRKGDVVLPWALGAAEEQKPPSRRSDHSSAFLSLQHWIQLPVRSQFVPVGLWGQAGAQLGNLRAGTRCFA